MKTAILLVGNIRTWENCKQNFIETFGNLNPDIFVSTYNLQYNYHPYIKNFIQEYDDDFLTNDEIISKFDDVNLKSIAIDNPESYAIPENVNPLFSGMETSFYQYCKFNQAINLMKSLEEGNEYDLVIKTRCDLLYNKIDFSAIGDSILIDSGNVFPNDCILISKRNNLVNISEFIVNEFFNPIYSDSNLHPPHGLLLNAIKHFNIPVVTDRIMSFVVRKNNKLQQY